MDDGDHDLIQNTKGDKAPLGIIEAIVFVGIGRTLKDSLGVGEIEAMPLDIQLALRITPREPHKVIVYTIRLCVKVAWQRVRAHAKQAPRRKRSPGATGVAGSKMSTFRTD